MECEMPVILWGFGNDLIVPETDFRRIKECTCRSSDERVMNGCLVMRLPLPHVHVLMNQHAGVRFLD